MVGVWANSAFCGQKANFAGQKNLNDGSRPSAYSNPIPTCNLDGAAAALYHFARSYHYEDDDTSGS